MNWLLYPKVDSIKYDPITQHLTLNTDKGEITSTDGGFRWSVSQMEYQPGPIATETAPFQGDRNNNNYWTIDVTIQGNAFFADSLVDDFYKRPPYVSLQLVSKNYPIDGSEPVWFGNFDRYLKGTIQIPKANIQSSKEYLLYVEVRDFYWNVQTGHALINGLKDTKIKIPIFTSHLLPALCR